jgi:hypothetical protein
MEWFFMDIDEFFTLLLNTSKAIISLAVGLSIFIISAVAGLLGYKVFRDLLRWLQSVKGESFVMTPEYRG